MEKKFCFETLLLLRFSSRGRLLSGNNTFCHLMQNNILFNSCLVQQFFGAFGSTSADVFQSRLPDALNNDGMSQSYKMN